LKRSYKIIRAILVTLLILAIVIPLLFYALLSMSGVQERMKTIAEEELTKLLDARVDIGSLRVGLFDRVTLSDVTVKDKRGVNALAVSTIDAGVDLRHFLDTDQILVTYAEIDGLQATVYRDAPGTPLNIQPIIEALKPKDKNKPPTRFNLRLSHVYITGSGATYDVRSLPLPAQGRFDPNHISVSGLELKAVAPLLKNDDFTVELQQLALKERSGFTLENLAAAVHVTPTATTVKGLTVKLPGTLLLPGDIAVGYDSFGTMERDIAGGSHSLELKQGTYVTLSDLKAFVPALARYDFRIDADLDAIGSRHELSLRRLNVACEKLQTSVAITDGHLSLPTDNDMRQLSVSLPSLKVRSVPTAVISTLNLPVKSADLRDIIAKAGEVTVDGDLSGTIVNAAFDGNITTRAGSLDIDATYAKNGNAGPSVKGRISTPGFNVGSLVAKAGKVGTVALNADIDMTVARPYPRGHVSAGISRLEFKGYPYTGITLDATSEDNVISGSVSVSDPNATVSAQGHYNYGGARPETQFFVESEGINFARINLANISPSRSLRFKADASLEGRNLSDIDGWLKVTDVSFTNEEGQGVMLDLIDITADNSSTPQRLTLNSDVINGEITGSYNFATVEKSAREILHTFLPALIPPVNAATAATTAPAKPDDFDFSFTIKDNDNLQKIVKLPFNVIYPVTINGLMSQTEKRIKLKVDAPYLLQGDKKLIKGSAIDINVDGNENQADVYMTTVVPTKRGDLTLTALSNALDNKVNTQIDWVIPDKANFSGDINFTTSLQRVTDEDTRQSHINTLITMNPSQAVFNDTVWTIPQSSIDIKPGLITVDGFKAYHADQLISIDGVASASPDDRLTLALRDIDLDYIFSTLNISDNIMFGGYATGDFYALGLLSKSPVLYTPRLDVKDLSYNRCVMGDGIITSAWDPETKAITIKATIDQTNGLASHIDGFIKPATEELDFKFDANKASVGFLRPFMSAFADDVTGYASGNAHLYGTFKLIDMVGDLYADDIKLKLGFTGVTYSAQDSVHIRPGRIELKDITLRDPYGNTAKLNGWLTHECFKRPVFDFNITDARNMLVYDIKENPDQNWYGRIFGNGTASVSGKPGQVNIAVDMSTTAKSTFTFVLSDAEIASDYTFITFRDRDRKLKDPTLHMSPEQLLVHRLEERIAAQNKDNTRPSTYDMDLKVAVNPQAEVILVMDPIGGDRIRAHGSGTLRMTYNSANEDLRMFGTYTLEHGSYNFTLQSIILKDFKINEGSTITFNGDPYSADLDINAIYTLNANLSDLDESFLHDKDLQRTNVPVNAVMLVTGDMRQPHIGFDIKCPTLNADVDRKIHSIVSTEEMMSQQILYLLALNRFYTPEYMASTTKGNELVSVASSTISSQLGSMLGALSDNWSIAPNFRSDRGDFSDVEFDVALSSHLLNNRLLLNGNFGYRDKALNNNSFIGDFDVEYLLNRSGSLRLKAYNRYNDQNFYVKTALTTQGVGIVYKRDFDNIFSFMKPIRQWFSKKKTQPAPPDSITITINDSIAIK